MDIRKNELVVVKFRSWIFKKTDNSSIFSILKSKKLIILYLFLKKNRILSFSMSFLFYRI